MFMITGIGAVGEVQFSAENDNRSIRGAYLGEGWHNPWTFSQYEYVENEDGEMGWFSTGVTEGHPTYENTVEAVKRFFLE